MIKKSLFVGIIHAILCRGWKIRTKWRDLYDYVFFLAHNTSINVELVRNKLIELKYINPNETFNIDALKDLLIKKFKEIDYNDAKKAVIPFIRNIESLEIWNSEIFISITEKIS